MIDSTRIFLHTSLAEQKVNWEHTEIEQKCHLNIYILNKIHLTRVVICPSLALLAKDTYAGANTPFLVVLLKAWGYAQAGGFGVQGMPTCRVNFIIISVNRRVHARQGAPRIWAVPRIWEAEFTLPARVIICPSLAMLAKDTYAGANKPCIVLTQVGRFVEVTASRRLAASRRLSC